MAISVDAFLQARGFRSNPFAKTNAEQEKEILPAYFVCVSWFDQLVGDPSNPESLILFAPQGYGKTSHRLEIARIAGACSESAALVVHFTDFESLLAPGVGPIGIESYIAPIRKLTLEALDDALRRQPERELRLQHDPTRFACFSALLKLYCRRRAMTRPAPNALVELYEQEYRQSSLTFREWLHELVELARAVGFASIYVLLDCLDESARTRDKPAVMFQLLSPLLDAPNLLQECGFAFKFFLPQTLQQPMQREGIGRLDRIPQYQLKWSEHDLRKMLSERLKIYSRIDQTSSQGHESFAILCAEVPEIDRWLVQHAAGSPRQMIYLARSIVDEHCKQATSVDSLIDAPTIKAILQGGASVPKLRVRSDGEVLLGERTLEKKLPKLLHKSLKYLWAHRGEVVPYDALVHELYADDHIKERGDPRDSVGRLILRLRKSLEPKSPDPNKSETYIAVQPGIGYVLRNFEDDPPED
jgi:hypothetical protein